MRRIVPSFPSTQWLAPTLAGWLAAAVPLGCSTSDDVECRSGADCASGICLSNGTCAAESTTTGTGGGAGGAGAAGGQSTSGGAGAGGGASGGGGAHTCLPNDDGTIELAEIPIGPGLHASYLATADVSVDTAGEAQTDGSRLWAFDQELTGDHLVLIETRALDNQWYEELFPGASYTALLSSQEELLGVFELRDAQLLLRGVVSPDDGLYRTELTYETPIVVLDFPLTEDKTWQTGSTVSGLASGVWSYYTEDYDYEVDAHGQVATPFGTFQVLRTRQTLTRTVGYYPTVVRSFVFVAECFSSVASVTSQNDEAGIEFTDAAEVRRLSP